MVKGKEDANYSYTQADWFGSWRDMDDLRLRNELIDKKRPIPKSLAEIKALHCPKNQVDWRVVANKNYKQVVHLDADGCLTYTYMVAKKVADTWQTEDGKWVQGEHVSYLLCTPCVAEQD